MSDANNYPLIDLIALGHKAAPPTSKPFASHIASLAIAVIHPHMDPGEVQGIRACIAHHLQVLRWSSYFLGIPISSNRFTDGSFDVEGREYVLPNSIIATVQEYRGALSDHSSGLASIVRTELRLGIELACVRSLHESDIATAKGVPLLTANSTRRESNGL